MSTIDGLTSGLDTTAIINQLMAIERRPQTVLNSRKGDAEKAKTELSGIRTDINALRALAKDFRVASTWNALKASSTNPEAVTVKATSGASTGTYTFQVSSLATAASVYSTDTFASTSTVVAPTGSTLFSATGHQALGIQNLTGAGFDPGAIAFAVIQRSTEAKLEGVVDIPAVPIEIDGTNDDIDIEVDGLSYTISLGHAAYGSEDDLKAALDEAIANSPAAGKVAAGLTTDHRITLATVAEGSDHSIRLTGGDGLGSLGLAVSGTTTGTDGIIEVDGNLTTVTDAGAGTQVTVNTGGTGTITATLAGGLRSGTAEVAQVSVGGGTLAEVVDTVNRAGLSYTAAAVNVGGGYRLQLTAKETGAASAFTPDPGIFGATGFTTLSAGTDARITVEGANPFTVSSATNTFKGLLPGVDVTVNKTTTAPVTISTERDNETVTTRMEELVTKVNEILGRIAKATANEPGQTRSVLRGDRASRQAADALRSALVGPVEGSGYGSVGMVGVELNREGTLTFDKTKFAAALESKPTEVARLFTDPATTGATGALDRLVAAADSAAAASTGYLFTAGESQNRRIDDYGRQIDAYERRLSVKEAALRRTYANLEVALNGLQKQSSNLAAQLGS